MITRLGKKLRKLLMAKNMKRKGKSARNGNAPAPYTRYGKVPYKYSASYYEWRNSARRKGGKEPYEQRAHRQ